MVGKCRSFSIHTYLRGHPSSFAALLLLSKTHNCVREQSYPTAGGLEDVRGTRRWWWRQCRSRSRWVSIQFTGRSTKWSAVSSTEPVAEREMLNVIFVKMRCSVSRFMQGLSFDIWFRRTITCLKTSSWAFHHGNPDQRWLHRVERLGQHRHLHSPGVEGRGRDLSSWSWQVPSWSEWSQWTLPLRFGECVESTDSPYYACKRFLSSMLIPSSTMPRSSWWYKNHKDFLVTQEAVLSCKSCAEWARPIMIQSCLLCRDRWNSYQIKL